MSHSDIPTWTLLNIGHISVNTEWAYSDVCSPFTRLYCIMGGSGQLLMRDRIVTLTPGNLYIIPAYTLHTTRCDNEMDHFYLHVHENMTGEGFPLYEEWIFPDSLAATENDIMIFKKLLELNPHRHLAVTDPKRYDTHVSFMDTLNHGEQRPLIDRLKNNSLITMLMTRWMCAGKRRKELRNLKIAHAVSYIQSHFRDEMSVEQLASAALMSRHHFSRLFKEETGLSIGNYLRHLRIRKSQIMLAHTKMSVKEIGGLVGYNDYNYFIRVFHKETGITPSHYRQSMNI